MISPYRRRILRGALAFAGGAHADTAPTLMTDSANPGATPSATATSENTNFVVNVASIGATADGLEQTAYVQLALASLERELGGIVFIPRGVKFNLKGLHFPKRSTLWYFADDDISTGAGTTLATNEIVQFIANANNHGIVNEHRLTAAYHPGFVIDVRKDVPGHDAFLGVGQSRSEPARASWNIHDEELGRFRVLYENYEIFTPNAGVRLEAYIQRFTLIGISTRSFRSVPVAGSLITGKVSGAKGWIVSVGATNSVVTWISGKFVVGETVVVQNQETTDTVTSATLSTAISQMLGVDFTNGNWSVGLAPGRGVEVLNVGGKIAVGPTVSVGQHLAEIVTNPGYVWIDSFVNPQSGFEIVYDKVPIPSRRRLKLRHFNSDTDRGFVGAVGACTGFTNALDTALTSFNVAAITRSELGDYTIKFINAFATADYMVSFATSHPMDYAFTALKTTSTLRVRIVTTGTTIARDLTGTLDVTCVAGDIS